MPKAPQSVTEGPSWWGISGDAGGLVRHQQPGDEVDQDLRAWQEKAGHKGDSNNGGIEIEATGDTRAHARDQPVVIRAVELHVALYFRDTVEVWLLLLCAINARSTPGLLARQGSRS